MADAVYKPLSPPAPHQLLQAVFELLMPGTVTPHCGWAVLCIGIGSAWRRCFVLPAGACPQ